MRFLSSILTLLVLATSVLVEEASSGAEVDEVSPTAQSVRSSGAPYKSASDKARPGTRIKAVGYSRLTRECTNSFPLLRPES
jgi:hypothetical protein